MSQPAIADTTTLPRASTAPQCRACRSATEPSDRLIAREMMLGLGGTFSYFECADCGTLQIEAIPNDLARYYGDGYYSLSVQRPSLATRFAGSLKRVLCRHRLRYALGCRDPLGRLALGVWGPLMYFPWVKHANVGLNDAILDVGCGAGNLLITMAEAGYADLTGVDPFVARDTRHPLGVSILKKTIFDLTRTYDFVLMSHSLEHVPDPLSLLRHAYKILRPGKFLLVRVPLAGSYASKRYRENWYSLDAPRHIFLPTIRAMRLLATESRFQVSDIVYDSQVGQIINSERYRRGLNGTQFNLPECKVAARDMREIQQQVQQLNATGEGDQACFYLQKPMESA